MKFTSTALSAVALLVSSSVADDAPQTAHLTFRDTDKAAAYSLTVLADGTQVGTDRDHLGTKIALVDAPDYNAAVLCDFSFATPPGAPTPKTAFTIGDDGHTGQVSIDPPTGIMSVRCEGHCVPNLGTCNGADGQPPKLCCNGYCAADHCRPWDGI